MQSQGNGFSRFIKSPIGILLGAFIILVLVILGIFIFTSLNSSDRFVIETHTEIDPASGETINIDNTASENEIPQVLYLGFTSIAEAGLTSDQYDLLSSIINTYTGVNLPSRLERVSFQKNSLIIDSPNVFQFTIVLNTDQITLDVLFDASLSPGTTGNISVTFSQGSSVVWRY